MNNSSRDRKASRRSDTVATGRPARRGRTPFSTHSDRGLAQSRRAQHAGRATVATGSRCRGVANFRSAASSSATPSDAMASPSKPAATSRRPRAANSNNSALHHVGIGDIFGSETNRPRKTIFSDPECTQSFENCALAGCHPRSPDAHEAANGWDQSLKRLVFSASIAKGTVLVAPRSRRRARPSQSDWGLPGLLAITPQTGCARRPPFGQR